MESVLVLTELDMLKLMICKIFAKSEKVRVLQSEATAGPLDGSFNHLYVVQFSAN